ncbi:MAG: 16S rRNA (cytosine(1402)-N(4))-methyltransferase RsmH [Elusimicrobiota bacterium]
MHIPVLLNEVIENLHLKTGDTVVDATFGAGGHAKIISKRVGLKGAVIGFEKDERTYKAAKENFNEYSNIKLINRGFEFLSEELVKLSIKKINAILFDLGVSSMQFDEEERGFSFRYDATLDMRFNIKQKLSAKEVVNTFSEDKLSNIIYKYGEDRFARRIAGAICRARKNTEISTTGMLKDIILHAVPVRRSEAMRTVTRTFQAIRIEVNNELEVLETGIRQALDVLENGGRLAVISFHSLEDRIVKRYFQNEAKDCICAPDILQCVCGHKKRLKIVTKSPITPGDDEISLNQRSRSAKLRVCEKI